MKHFENIPLISVIVPVFQVEEYLDKCISSIIDQSYKNLEILLIDDGSTDNSPQICEKWKNIDSRINVIHNKHAGLSCARNIGLMIAKGGLITFVDSDDWIEPNAYEVLVELFQTTGCDIAICSQFQEFENIEELNEKELFIKKIFTTEEALKILINRDKYINYAVWNKIYKRNILININFPEGKIHEDIIWTTKVIINAKKIVFINYPLYHYRYRNNSISHNNKILVQRINDKIEMCHLRNEYISNFYPTLVKRANFSLQELCYYEFENICKNYDFLDKDKIIRKELHKQFCRLGIINIFIKKQVFFKYLLFGICPFMLFKIIRIFKNIKCKYIKIIITFNTIVML